MDRFGLSVGVSDQVAEANARTRRLGWPDLAVYSDNDISAADRRKKRPRFERLLEDMRTGAVDALVVRHLDRLLRQVLDLERILDAIEAAPGPVQVLMLEGGDIDMTTASGRLLARILTSVAANESEIKSERLIQARARDAQAGRAHRNLGYGYHRDRTINEGEASIVKEVARRILAGESWGAVTRDLNTREVPTPGAGRWVGNTVDRVDSEWGRINYPQLHSVIRLLRAEEPIGPDTAARALRAAGSAWTIRDVKLRSEAVSLSDEHVSLAPAQVARVLNDAGVPPPGSSWTSANLRVMMTRGALAGWRDHDPGARTQKTTLRGRRVGEMVARGDWAPILGKETVEQLRRNMTTGGRQATPQHLLSSTLVCGRCGRKLTGAFSSDPRVTGKRGGITWRYLCPKRAGGGCGLSVAGEELDQVVTGWIFGALLDTDFRTRGRRRPNDPRVQAALDRLATYSTERAAFQRMWAKNFYDNVAAYEADMEASKRREEADRAIVDAAVPRAGFARVVASAPTDLEALRGWWDAQDLLEKRDTIKALVSAIPVTPSPTGRGRGTPPAQRLGEPLWRV